MPDDEETIDDSRRHSKHIHTYCSIEFIKVKDCKQVIQQTKYLIAINKMPTVSTIVKNDKGTQTKKEKS